MEDWVWWLFIQYVQVQFLRVTILNVELIHLGTTFTLNRDGHNTGIHIWCILTYIGIIYTKYIVIIYMSPYILSIGISYKISYKDFLYGGNPGVWTLNEADYQK